MPVMSIRTDASAAYPLLFSVNGIYLFIDNRTLISGLPKWDKQ